MHHSKPIQTRVGLRTAAAFLACGALAACGSRVDSASSATEEQHATVIEAAQHDVSAPLSLMPAAPRQARPEHEPKKFGRHINPANATDPVLQASATTVPSIPTPATSFNGIGNGFSGPAGAFTVQSAPPDTNGDIGPNHYVQTVNSDFAIFNKSGTALYGPVQINTLWSGFGGLCQTDNDGDPIVLYDSQADRWMISQFAVTNPNPNYYQCVAVSQTNDPTGAYYRYAFPYTGFNDYGKAGVWSDGYYWTYNMFTGGSTFAGAKICAMDRASMLTGAAANQQCFDAGTNYGGLLPADLDGATPPPAGAPETIVGLGSAANTLAVWKFHVDWTTPANSTFTGPATLATAAFSEACAGGTCVPQSGTTQKLDSLADRMMYRLSYRRFSDHESLVVNHSVTAGSSTGVRWYELRLDASRNASIFQQGTYAPDSNYRWMGSVAMDQQGNMGLGFSLSGSSLHPAVHYTGRLAADAAGTMTQGEGSLIDGAGSQGGTQALSRWGDYSMLGVDPTDNCTFWFTTEYIPANGTFNWATRIGSFKFPGCGGVATNEFSISANPASVTVAAGSSGSTTINTTTTSGASQSVSLSASGLPAGATASFSPATINSGNSSTMTIATSSSTTPGSYSVTVTGAGASATHSTTVSLSVSGITPPPPPPPPGGITNGGFESGLTGWTSTGTTAAVAGGHSGASAARVGSTSPGTDSSLAQSFTAPSGATTLSFFYKVVCPDTVTYDWATATLTDTTTGTTTTMLAKTCTNSGAWVQASASVVAGHGYTLTLSNHDDNYASDPTYTLYDDVGFNGSAPPPPPPPPGGITNGNFASGLTGWTVAGTCSAVSGGAQCGSTTPTNGDSSLSQTFTVPSGATTLSFGYQVTCPDSVTYDWATATLKDNATGTTTTILAKTCTNTGTTSTVNAAVTAGHSVTLTLTSHDDNYAGDATYTKFSNVATR